MTRTFKLKSFESLLDISVRVELDTQSNSLGFKFEVDHRPAFLVEALKPPAERLRKDGLWSSTCFELFFSWDDVSYFEMNLSPSGDWQFYEFEAYRKRAPLPQGFQLFQLQSERSDERYEISGAIESQFMNLSEIQRIHPCVMLNLNGKNSFWAPRHNLDSPDFHCRSTWSNWKN